MDNSENKSTKYIILSWILKIKNRYHTKYILLFIASVFGFSVTADAEFDILPENAILLIPSESNIIIDNKSFKMNSDKIIKKGESLFKFEIISPYKAILLQQFSTDINTQLIQFDIGLSLEPFSRGKIDQEYSVKIFCTNKDHKITKFAKDQLKGMKADKPKICLIDEGSDNSFNYIMLDAVFIDGNVPSIARKIIPISPAKYKLDENYDKRISGKYEVYFRGFPIQNDRLSLAMRRVGSENSRPILNILFSEIENNDYVNYYTSYNFVRYNRYNITNIKFIGAEINIIAVNRQDGTMQFNIQRVRNGRIFTVFDYENYVPVFRDFSSGI
jgi:hypothetical protein